MSDRPKERSEGQRILSSSVIETDACIASQTVYQTTNRDNQEFYFVVGRSERKVQHLKSQPCTRLLRHDSTA